MSGNKFELNKDGALLFIIIGIHVVCWFAMKPILPQSDPLVYFVNAKRILTHEYFFSHSVQSHRYGVFIPQAVLMWLFGEGPYVINLWPLICSISTIAITYIFLQKFLDRDIAVVAGLLLCVNLIQIIYSSVVFPDMIVSLFVLCCIYFMYKGRIEKDAWLKNSILFILCFAFGFSAKESIAVILPFTVFIFWKDQRENNFFNFQKSVSMLLILFAAFILTVSKIVTGDFLFFYRSYSHYTLFVPFEGCADFLKHVSYLPLFWFNSQPGYIFLFIFSVPAFIDGIKRKDKFMTPESFISLYTVVLLISLWCGSISILNFGYIPLVDRRWMTLIAPLSFLSAITIHGIIQNTISRKAVYFLTGAFILLAILNSIEFTIIRGAMFFAFAGMLMLQEMTGRKIANRNWIRVGILLLPFFILAIRFLRNNSNYVVPVN